MFGTDEHSLALLAQWRRSKMLRDPVQLEKLAADKGLTLIKAVTLDAEQYSVVCAGKRLFYGNLENTGKFVDEYTIVTQL